MAPEERRNDGCQMMSDKTASALHQHTGRTARIIATLAGAGETGLHFADVMRASGLSKATTHRILSGMVLHQLVDFDERTRCYFLGMRMFGWSVAAGNRFGLRAVGPALDRLVEKTQDTIYLLVRSGLDAFCLDRREGNRPIKILPLHVGERRPLGVGAGGIALLAFMPDSEIEQLLPLRRAELQQFGIKERELRDKISLARQQGFASIEGMLTDNISAVGVPLIDRDGAPIASISVAALSDRLTGARRKEVVRLLQAEAAIYRASMGR
jgi:DNA-binding IclR family transcriptional regulator